MLPVETFGIARHDVTREVADAVLARTGRGIDGLVVDCDGEVITIRGHVGTYYSWQLGFSAARHVSCKHGGLLLDYQVQVVASVDVD